MFSRVFIFMHRCVYMDVCGKYPKTRPKLGGCITGETLMTQWIRHLLYLLLCRPKTADFPVFL